MRRSATICAAVGLVLQLIVAPSAAVAQEESSWIVTLAPGVDPSAAAHGLSWQHAGSAEHLYEHVLNGFSFRGSRRAAAALERHPAVLRVQRSGVYELTEQGPFGVLRIGAWAANQAGHTGRTADGTKVRVAVLDSGVMANHPDLEANVDVGEGRNCVIGADPTDPSDDHGHGTHVAGTIGAALNGDGVIGVATDVSIAAVKVVNAQGSGTDAEILCGLEHVAALAADGTPTVINMSLGEARNEGVGCASSPLHQAICNLHAQNVVIVAAMGNSSQDGSSFYPAAFPETIGVSAFTDLNGTGGASSGCQFFLDSFSQCDESLANFTNWGSKVDLTAPGVNVLSTTFDGASGPRSGTSMASPHVAGAAALVLAADPTLSPDAVRTLLQETGECPDGTTSGAATCAGRGQWTKSQIFGGTTADPDGIPEPLVNALAAAEAAAAGAVDLVPPVITLNPPNPQFVTVGNAYPEFGANAVDDRDGDISASITVDASAVDTATVGSYPVTYDVSDSAGNSTQVVRTVEVVATPDTTAPVMTLNGPNPLVVAQDDPYVEEGATAIDSFEGDLSPAVVIDSSAVDTATVGSYEVTYDVSDSLGNAAPQLVRTVQVIFVDRTPPVITLLGDDPQTVVQGFRYVESGATALDDVDGDVSAAIVIDASAVDTSAVGGYPVTYDVSDAAGNAAQTTRTVDVVAASPQTSHAVDFSAMSITAYGNQDVDSVMAVEDGGASLRLTGNGWKKLQLPTVITPNSVLEFDFSSSSQGEVHGIGFDADEALSADTTFRVYGTQVWGIADFATYSGSGVTHYRIPVGQYFTGTFDYLVFAADHDVSTPNAESWFSNVELYDAVPADVSAPVITLLGDDPQTITEGDPYVELGATAFDDFDGDVSSSIVIDSSAVDTSVVGAYQVVYQVSDAAGNTAQAVRQVDVVDASSVPPGTIDFSALQLTSYGNQDVNSIVAVEDGGASLRLTGNGWKKIELPTVITPDTVLEFDFSSSARGEVHGIGFDTDEALSANTTFRVYGTQNWGLSQYANYVGPGTVHYKIPVGQHFTGTFDYVVFVNDHDVGSPTAESLFSNVRIYDAAPLTSYVVDFAEMQVGAFGAQDVDSVMVVEDGGASLRVTGNGWKMIAIPTELTPNSVLEFDFSSSAQGEVHGIGFDTDLAASANTTFRVYGTQNWGLSQYATYVGPGTLRYTIPVGQHFTGRFAYIVFVNDHDVGSPTAESWFSNVRLYEAAP